MTRSRYGQQPEANTSKKRWPTSSGQSRMFQARTSMSGQGSTQRTVARGAARSQVRVDKPGNEPISRTTRAEQAVRASVTRSRPPPSHPRSLGSTFGRSLGQGYFARSLSKALTGQLLDDALRRADSSPSLMPTDPDTRKMFV